MAEQKTITPQVLQGVVDGVLSTLINTYNDQVQRSGDQSAKVPALDKLGQALQAMQQQVSNVMTGKTSIKDWAGWARQAANGLVVSAGQLKSAGIDKTGDTIKSAAAAKQAVEKSLQSIGITGPNLLLMGLGILALGAVGAWAYKSSKKSRASYGDGEDDEDDPDGLGEGEVVELDTSAADEEDEDEEDKPARRRWSTEETSP